MTFQTEVDVNYGWLLIQNLNLQDSIFWKSVMLEPSNRLQKVYNSLSCLPVWTQNHLPLQVVVAVLLDKFLKVKLKSWFKEKLTIQPSVVWSCMMLIAHTSWHTPQANYTTLSRLKLYYAHCSLFLAHTTGTWDWMYFKQCNPLFDHEAFHSVRRLTKNRMRRKLTKKRFVIFNWYFISWARWIEIHTNSWFIEFFLSSILLILWCKALHGRCALFIALVQCL